MPWVGCSDRLIGWLVVGVSQDSVPQYCILFYQPLLIDEYKTMVE